MDSRHVLVIRVASLENVDYTTMRNDILESVRLGVLILGADDALEVLDLPPLGGVEVERAEPVPVPEQPEKLESAAASEGMEKRAIVQRLKGYRAANGLGSLEAVSMKTAHQKGRRLSSETLRHICADGAPRMPMEDWRKITRALDLLERTEGGDG